MLNLRFKVFVMQRNEKNKRTVLQVNILTILYSSSLKTREVTLGVNNQRNERTTTTNNEI